MVTEPKHSEGPPSSSSKIRVADIDIAWNGKQGTCTFENLGVAMMWIDTTLAGLMSGVQAMVGTERFGLALQSQGRKSVDDDWRVISQFSDFQKGFEAIANIAAVAGWGDWHLMSVDEEKKECRFRVLNSWEGRYQKALGVCWGSAMLAGKLAGYCSILFKTNCWADQTAFLAAGDDFDEFTVGPSKRSIEQEIENLLTTDEATRADMAVALHNLQIEVKERKRAEETLRESEARFRKIVQATDAGYFFVDLNGLWRDVNDAWLKMHGYSSREEVIGKHFSLTQVDEDMEAAEKIVEKLLSGESIPTGEFSRRCKDGSIAYHTYSVNPVVKGGKVVGLEGFVIDVTKRRRAEMERRMLEEQLRHAQKMESIGTLTSGVAHNFRNILGAISMDCQLVHLLYKDDEHLQKMAERTNSCVTRGARLVEHLLQFSREQAKEYEVVNVAEILQETYGLITQSFDKKINICIDIPDLVHIRGDHAGLSQVFMNLCSNARDAMPKGGELRIEARTEEDNVLITISDTGHGMDEETQEKCFDPFFTTKDVDKGTGLGLSTTYGIVKDHAGEILVFSELNKGTTFRLYLPLSLSDQERKQVRMPDIVRGSGEKILVVDDEMEILKPMEQLVEMLGYLVASVTSGMAAVDKYKSWEPDVVLLDRNMPEMDGITCAERILEYDAGARIVLISGYEEEGPSGIDDKTKSFIKGYLTKPIDMEGLSQVLGRLLADAKSEV